MCSHDNTADTSGQKEALILALIRPCLGTLDDQRVDLKMGMTGSPLKIATLRRKRVKTNSHGSLEQVVATGFRHAEDHPVRAG